MSARFSTRMTARFRSRLSAIASSRAFFVSAEALLMCFHAAFVFFRMSMVVIYAPSLARKRVPTGLPATMSYKSSGRCPLAMTISQPAAVTIWAA